MDNGTGTAVVFKQELLLALMRTSFQDANFKGFFIQSRHVFFTYRQSTRTP
jgi:hypothetical protein